MEKLYDSCGGKILVAGAKGFIGSAITKYLLSEGFDVLPVSREECDLCDSKSVDALFSDNSITKIINCAAKTGFRNEAQTIDVFYENILIHENLSRHPVDLFISLGSGDEFDHGKEVLDAKESFLGTRIPESFYGFSKYVIAKRVKGNNSQVNLRLFGLFGPGESQDRFISGSIRNIFNGEPIRVYEDVFMDFFYVEDLCKDRKSVV